jgi:hypothetical protein
MQGKVLAEMNRGVARGMLLALRRGTRLATVQTPRRRALESCCALDFCHGSGCRTWRWMGHRSTLRVPAVRRPGRDALAPKMLGAVSAMLVAKRLMFKEGTVIDARLVAASSSIKTVTGTRDPEMHQATMGNGATNFDSMQTALCRTRGGSAGKPRGMGSAVRLMAPRSRGGATGATSAL